MLRRIHIVAGFIHKDICALMIDAAKDEAKNLGFVIDRCVWVPGSLEAPLAVSMLIEKDLPDAIIVFGVQQQGKTKHGEVIANQATAALLNLQLQHRMPMAIAIIGPDATLEYAREKSDRTARKALRAAVYMANLVVSA